MSLKVVSKTLHASDVEVTSGTGAAVNCKSETGAVYLSITGGNSPNTIDVTVEEQDPESGIWYEIAAFAQATVATTEKISLTGFIGSNLRAVWTLSAGSPGFIFEVTFAGKSPA